jgi:bifunctional DNA-binding transcriptional regulator/antitoxin component of YhaV-PrlF toxin-antitoxin module
MSREYHIGVQSRGTLALPAELRKRHHLDEPGAQVRVVERDDGVIELHPLAAVPADQRWFWTERWQRMEREVDEHIAAGREKVYDDVDAFLASLDE